VPLDSIPAVVGSARFVADADRIAERSVVMVKDSSGVVHDLRRTRPALTLVTYAEEDNRTVGTALAAELRTQGFAVTLARLWPASGGASYDSVAALLARGSTAVFATADRPVAGRGAIGLPAALTALIAGTARARPAVLVSLGNPYLIGGLPEVGSYLIGWRSNAVTERAAARALAGVAPITGRLPIALPPRYPRGWGLQVQR
jgi:beta-N-acetylhexosaminidase